MVVVGVVGSGDNMMVMVVVVGVVNSGGGNGRTVVVVVPSPRMEADPAVGSSMPLSNGNGGRGKSREVRKEGRKEIRK